MVRKRHNPRTSTGSRRSEFNIRHRKPGDRKVKIYCTIDDVINLLLLSVQMSGETIPLSKLDVFNKTVTRMIKNTRSNYRFRKGNIPEDIVIPILTKSNKPISLPAALAIVKDLSKQWKKSLETNSTMTSTK